MSGPGDRIGIIGVNGSGKTHLLRLLAGDLQPTSGTVQIGQTVQAAHLSQEVTRAAGRAAGARGRAARSRTTAELGGVELSATQLAERFGFANDRQWTPVARSVRRRAAPAAAAATAARPAERAAARRADQRPGHRHPRRARGPARLAGPARWSSSATTATCSSGCATRRSPCSATARSPRCPAASTSTWPGGPRRRTAAVSRAPREAGRLARRPQGADPAGASDRVARQARSRRCTTALAEHATDFTRVAELDAELRAVVAEREAAEEPGCSCPTTSELHTGRAAVRVGCGSSGLRFGAAPRRPDQGLRSWRVISFGSGSRCARPFQPRLTRCAATSSRLGLRSSSHHCRSARPCRRASARTSARAWC